MAKKPIQRGARRAILTRYKGQLMTREMLAVEAGGGLTAKIVYNRLYNARFPQVITKDLEAQILRPVDKRYQHLHSDRLIKRHARASKPVNPHKLTPSDPRYIDPNYLPDVPFGDLAHLSDDRNAKRRRSVVDPDIEFLIRQNLKFGKSGNLGFAGFAP